MIKVVIVDDHPAIRNAWQLFLSTEDSIEIVGVYNSGKELIENLAHVNADVILMDINMPGMSGMEAAKQVLQIKPDIKIIAVSTHTSPAYVKAMIDAGAKGYVSKFSVSEQLIKAIKEVYKGNVFIGEGIA